MHATFGVSDSSRLWLSAIALPERVGRWLMDFGFGSLVEKFEERVGRRATTVLLYGIGAATLIICVNTVITQGIIPVVDFVRGVSSKTVLGLLSDLLVGSLIAVVSGAVFVFLVRWWVKRATMRIVEVAQEHVRRAEAVIDRAEEHSQRTRDTQDRIELLLDKAKRQVAKAQKATRDANAAGAKLGITDEGQDESRAS